MPRSLLTPRVPATLTRAGALCLVTAALTGCLRQDLVGVSNEDESNRHAVKIVEPTAITADAEDECITVCGDECGGCPQPPIPQNLPHFLNPTNSEYNFCTCPQGQYDTNSQPRWELYVEDRDGDGQEIYDELYAALQVDYELNTDQPWASIAYREFIDPGARLPPPELQGPASQPIGRPDPFLRRLQIGDGTRDVDLCNNTGLPTGSLTPGYHSLRVIVTDRPWFRRPDDGDGVEQEGVPDFASGASYDALTYVFHCADASEENSNCLCESPGGDQ